MRKTAIFSILVLIVASFWLAGCNYPAQSTQPAGMDGLYTQAAMTVAAQLTQSVATTPVIQSGNGTFTPTPTMMVLPGGLPSSTPLPTEPTVIQVFPTPIPATPTLTPTRYVISGGGSGSSSSVCNRASFVKDVAIEDGTYFDPSESFTKIWRVRNAGTCTWDENYAIVFDSGDSMGSRRAYPFDDEVDPGDTVDIAITLKAPSDAGRHRSYWLLRDEDGDLFGTGSDDSPLWVDIRVTDDGDADDDEDDDDDYDDDFSYDLIDYYCDADWTGSAGKVRCKNNSDPEDGYVEVLDSPRLEDGRRENEPALLTIPEDAKNGWISGYFPVYTVVSGDHFMAELGCLYGSEDCDVIFSLDYIISGESTVRGLGVWREDYDEDTTWVDIDLSPLAGRTITFILSVTRDGSSDDADAFWLVPSVRNSYHPTNTPVASRTPTVTGVPTATRTATSTSAPPSTATPIPIISITPGPVSQEAAIEAARQKMADNLDTDINKINLVSVEVVTWPDSCLGVYRSGVSCTPQSIPGFRIILSYLGDTYEAHTNQDGSKVTFVPPQ